MWVSKIIKYKKNGLESLFVFTGTFALTSFYLYAEKQYRVDLL